MKKLLFVVLVAVTVPVVSCGPDDLSEIFRALSRIERRLDQDQQIASKVQSCSSCNSSISPRFFTLKCCGAILCQYCWERRLDNALNAGVSPVCKKCGSKLDYDVDAQKAALAAFEKGKPSAPPAELRNNNAKMCASNCDTLGQVKLQCKGDHWMCASCLRGRIQNARIAAQKQGKSAFSVVCPVPGCGAIPGYVVNRYTN